MRLSGSGSDVPIFLVFGLDTVLSGSSPTIANWWAPLGLSSRSYRGRDARYRAPPAQIPAGAIRAPGSHLGCLTAKRLLGHG